MTGPQLTPEQHWEGFVAHARAVDAAGWNWLECLKAYAADPGYERDPAWVAFAHGVCYGFPSTAKLLERWPYPNYVLERSPEKVEDWFATTDLPFRKERLRHSSPKQAAETLRSAAEACQASDRPLQLEYDDVWKLVKSVKRFGRYQTIKVCGVLEALGCTEAKMPDIRPRGAKLGRRTLATLWPTVRAGDDAQTIDWFAERTLKKLRDKSVGMTDNPYLRLESLLCEYQQMLAGRFHADRGLQKDVAEWVQLFGAQYAPHDPGSYALPSAPLEPWQYTGPFRPELDRVYRDRGYVWSDKWYDWDATTDLDDPVPQRRS